MTYWNGSRDVRQVALTFDDAPTQPYTGQILGILKKYNIKATFFVVGLHTRKWPELVKQMIADGHDIANHTEGHVSLSSVNKKIVKEQVWGLQDHLEKTFGVRPRFFRPPHGAVNYVTLKGIEEAGMDLVFWDVDPQDWDSPGVLNIARRVANQVKPGSILLLHTLNPQSVETLPILIEYLKLDKFKIVPLSTLLGRSPYINTAEIKTIASSGDTRLIQTP